MYWNSSVPSGTALGLQIRTSKDEAGLTIAPFVGPDGTADTFYTVSGGQLWAGHDGDQWVQYKVGMKTTDDSITPYLFDLAIDYNLLPYPPTSIYPANFQLINTSSPEFRWAFSDPDNGTQGVFLVQLDNDAGFSSIDTSSGEITCSTNSWTPPTPIPDGKWNWRVKAKDSDGDWSDYNSTTFSVTIDTTPPVSTHVITGRIGWNGWATSAVNVTVSAVDATSGVAWSRYRLDNGSWTNYTTVFAVSAEGHHSVDYYSKDVANNTEAIKKVEFKIDTVPPILVVSAPADGLLTNSSPVEVTGSTEIGAIVKLNRVAVAVESGLFTSNMVLTEGDNVINLTAFDEAGNHRTVMRSVVLDTRAPVLDVGVLPALTNRSAQTLTGKAVDAHQVQVFVDGKSVPLLNGFFKANLTLMEGMNEILVVAQDLAGNMNRTTRKAVLDTIPPNIVILEPTWTKTKNSTANIRGRTEPNAHVFINGKELAVDANGGFNCSVTLRQGHNAFTIKAIDPAGNENHKGLSLERSSEPTKTRVGSECMPIIILVVLCAVAGVSIHLWYLRKKGHY